MKPLFARRPLRVDPEPAIIIYYARFVSRGGTNTLNSGNFKRKDVCGMIKHRRKTGLSALLARSMGFSLLPAAPVMAAGPTETAAIFMAAGESAGGKGAQEAALPERFDLRDEKLVSSPKAQDPWGSCWGFAATAAAEISILAEIRDYAERNGYTEMAEIFSDPDALDLSELQLAWFAATPYPEGDPDGQAGEGVKVTGTHPLNVSGSLALAASIYSSAVGPVSEETIPYRPKEWEDENARNYIGNGAWIYSQRDPDDPNSYADWSVDEEYRSSYLFELEDAYVLPAPAQPSEDYDRVRAEMATREIKEQLLDKRGVAVTFLADDFLPGQAKEGETPLYLNPETWAHYIWRPTDKDGNEVPDLVRANHAVCVVGWDDSYSVDNFLSDHRPPAPGAWICKNSWGALGENVPPNRNNWGVNGTGYFYLSYYD